MVFRKSTECPDHARSGTVTIQQVLREAAATLAGYFFREGMMGQIEIMPLLYSAEKYVKRDEANPVLVKVRDLLNGKPVPKRTVALAGERGTGKSWLLRHLEKTELPALGVLVFLLDLAVYEGGDPVSAVIDILKKFRASIIHQQNDFGAELPEMSRQVTQELRLVLRDKFLVILVDQAYESDWTLLSKLEEYLLGPLAVEPHVLMVMAGRGRAYPWKTPELRLYAEFKKIEPFNQVTQTAEQLEKQISKDAASSAEKIHDQSGGNPLANYYLGRNESLDSVIDYMMRVIASESRRIARQYLEALCVLQAFDEERIPAMLAAYYGDSSYLAWAYAQARQVRDLLVKSAFARWNEDQGGFVLDGQTRRLVENYLRTEQKEKWKNLQCAAYRLYKKWADEYTRAKTYWESQAAYHAQQLGADLEKCADWDTDVTKVSQVVSTPA